MSCRTRTKTCEFVPANVGFGLVTGCIAICARKPRLELTTLGTIALKYFLVKRPNANRRPGKHTLSLRVRVLTDCSGRFAAPSFESV